MTQQTKTKLGYIALGIGIGGVLGGGTSYIVAKRKLRKAERELEEARKAQKRAYMHGLQESYMRAQEWIDKNVKVIDANNPEEAQKAISEAFGIDDSSKSSEEMEEKPDDAPLEISNTSNPHQENPGQDKSEGNISYADDIYAEKESDEPKETIGEEEIGFRFKGKLLKYPRKLFFNDDGESLSETEVRVNLRIYEHDPGKLNEIWQALGYGPYFPDESEDFEMEDLDLDIEGDEPEEKSEERERYLEQVKRYNDNPNEGPRIVSKKEFDEECYLEKVWINYYAGDNVFVDSTDMDTEVDAVTLLGVSDGNYLFDNKPVFPEEEDDNDPDIVHVRNFKMNTIAEVTRQKYSYASVKDGSVYLDGNTDQSGGAGRM